MYIFQEHDDNQNYKDNIYIHIYIYIYIYIFIPILQIMYPLIYLFEILLSYTLVQVFGYNSTLILIMSWWSHVIKI